MRALHVAAGNLYGGVERILVEIAGARGAWRHDFAVCYEGRLLAELRQAGASCDVLRPVRFSRPATVWRARRHLNRRLTESTADALVCHSPWAFALAASCAKKSRRILWAHNGLGGAHWTERSVMRTPPHLIVCNSRYSASAVAAWLPAIPRHVVHPLVSSPDYPAETRAEVRCELGVADRTTVIMIASRLERLKGHHALLRAAHRLEGGWTLWIVGGAQRESEMALEAELRRFTATLGIDQRVRFFGERVDVRRVLRGADIFCQPNSSPEPFGVVFAEALAAGVPVVTTDAGGAPEIVDADCGILVPMGDEAALLRALQALIDDPSRRMALGAAGSTRARAVCDPAVQIARLEQVLAFHCQEALA